MENLKELNVVLLGGTGNGKSTLINMLANVSIYPDLDAAENGRIECPIPVRFKSKDADILHGSDDNERQEMASSRTRKPKIYSWKTDYSIISIIDCPGMGETEGTREDEEHVANIISCLNGFQSIHAIVVVVKSTENTLTSHIQYQLTKVLSCFAKYAAPNIRFILTHAGPFRQSGQSLNVIESFIESLDTKISLSKENCFCFENDSFKYLIARGHSEAEFSEEERKYFEKTYRNSAQEFIRFFSTLLKADTAYSPGDVSALNKGRQFWPILIELLTTLEGQLLELSEEVKCKKAQVETITGDIADAMLKLEDIKTVVYYVDVPKKRTELVTEEYEDTEEKIVYDDVVEQVKRWRTENKCEYYYESEPREVTVQETVQVPRQRVVTHTYSVDVPKERVEYVEVCVRKRRLFHGPRFAMEPRVVHYTEQEMRERQEVVDYTEPEVRSVTKIEFHNVQKQRSVPTTVEYTEEVTKKVPRTEICTVKKTRQVPKVVDYVEQEGREKLVKEVNPEVQQKLDQLQQTKVEEENNLEDIRKKYENFTKEIALLNTFKRALLNFLRENTLTGPDSDSGVDMNKNHVGDEVELTTENMLAQVAELCELRYVGRSVTEAFERCSEYDRGAFDTVDMKCGALFGKVAESITES